MVEKHRLLLLISFVAIVIVLGMMVFFRQSAFLKTYDAEYWKDRMEHSQWVLPVSRRTVGDDGIYAYGGYLLMQGKSIEDTYTNKPPVGIYLIGLSIILFHNPNYFAFISGILTLLIFYLLLKQFLKESDLAVFGVALLAMNPMFLSQLSIPLLDVLQMMFLRTDRSQV